MPPRYLRTSHVALLLGVSHDTVIREIAAGRLLCARQFKRPSGRTAYRISPDEVRAYVEEWGRHGEPADVLAALDRFLAA